MFSPLFKACCQNLLELPHVWKGTNSEQKQSQEAERPPPGGAVTNLGAMSVPFVTSARVDSQKSVF